MKTAISRQELLQKKELLETAKVELKKEFFGIEKVIDGVIDDISSWLLFPELQERPLVINLFGMTGTGKTSLLIRLSELLGFGKKCFKFEMSKGDNRQKIQSDLEDLFFYHNAKPTMIVFDEFQHLRSKDERGLYVQNDISQIIWKVLDSGKFDLVDYNHRKESLIDYSRFLEQAVNYGVKAEKGVVIEKAKTFIKLLDVDLENDGYFKKKSRRKRKGFYDPDEKNKIANLRFISESIIDDLAESLLHKQISEGTIRANFNKLNEKESLTYFFKILEDILAPKVVDCSKTVIFVVGNLDSAYPMSNDLNPDIDADFLYRKSLEINISDIKESLGEFLRLEQISRLGNIHHIYPSLSKQSYKQIIDKELSGFAAKVEKSNQVKIEFTDKTKQLVYSEGVYPTQGTRPLLSTINKIIRAKLGDVLGEAALQNWQSLNKIIWDVEEQGFKISYLNGNKTLGSKEIKVEKSLEKIRNDNDGEKRVVVATHEAGHALVHRVLFGESPEAIFSSTASSNIGGFVLTNGHKVISRNVGIKKIAVLLSGFLAEKEVFGPDSITDGAGEDLMSAKMLSANMVKIWSFQKFRRSSVYEDLVIKRDDLNASSEMNEILDESFGIAETILRKYQKAFLALSNQLMKQRMMTKEAIEKLILDNSEGLETEGLKVHPEGYYINKFQQKLTTYKS